MLVLILGGTLVMLADLWWPKVRLSRWSRPYQPHSGGEGGGSSDSANAASLRHAPAKLGLDTALPHERIDRTPLLLFGMLTVLVAIVAAWRLWMQTEIPQQLGMLVIGRYTLVGVMVVLGATLAALALGWGYLSDHRLPIGEYTALLLFASCGALCMFGSTNLLLMFLGLEILSVSAYVLAGLDVRNRLSVESALKYFLLGAVAAAFLLLGISFLYGVTGSFDLASFSSSTLTLAPAGQIYLVLGAGFFLVGIGFKVALAPFHTWTPDVYEGAPIPVTAWFASAVKAAAFLLFARVLVALTPNMPTYATTLIAGLSVATMFVGNLAALWQDNMKRLLAYSSIAHAGYAALSFVTMASIPEAGLSSLMWYLASYSVMTIGAFAVLQLLGRHGEEVTSVASMAGLGERHPWLAAMLSLFLLSLAGIPPTIGFMAKYFLFANLVSAGYVGLTIAAIVSSIISVGYYSYPIVVMYFRPVAAQTPRPIVGLRVPVRLVVFAAATIVIVAGVFPNALMGFIMNSLGR